MSLDERGQTTLELALCLPALMLLLGTLVQLGWLVGDQVRLWHAAREAARVAVVDPSAAPPRAAAERTGLRGVEIAIRPPAPYRVQGEPLVVSLSYAPRRVPIVGLLMGGIELHARAAMRIEQP
jgi:hypothetical protein